MVDIMSFVDSFIKSQEKKIDDIIDYDFYVADTLQHSMAASELNFIKLTILIANIFKVEEDD